MGYQNKVKNIGKGVRLLALTCPGYLVERKMIVLENSCPRYIVRAFFREADTFSTFVS